MSDDAKAWIFSIFIMFIMILVFVAGVHQESVDMSKLAIENQCAHYDAVTGIFTWGNLK